jgi:hypothetical protein
VIVDAHIHFWDPGVLDYPWLPDALRTPHVEFTGRAVVVEADARGDELSWLESLQPEAIVAHAPLEDRPDLAALAARPLVKGVRRLLQGTDLFDAVRPGVRELARYGLPFDACITQDQLPKLIALVAGCDETTIVLDHLGKPRALDPWRAADRAGRARERRLQVVGADDRGRGRRSPLPRARSASLRARSLPVRQRLARGEPDHDVRAVARGRERAAVGRRARECARRQRGTGLWARQGSRQDAN